MGMIPPPLSRVGAVSPGIGGGEETGDRRQETEEGKETPHPLLSPDSVALGGEKRLHGCPPR